MLNVVVIKGDFEPSQIGNEQDETWKIGLLKFDEKGMIVLLKECEFNKKIGEQCADFAIYPESVNSTNGCKLFLAKVDGQRQLIIVEQDAASPCTDFQVSKTIQVAGKNVNFAPLNHANAVVLRKWFDFTAPVAFGREGMSMGLGDRLGIASPGHLRIIKETGVRPVLAQQSIRELTLTNRRYEEVLDAASWAVFQEGYRLGFGADGDHLKTKAEVQMALDLGFTMITLDCSEKIDNTVMHKTAEQVNDAYQALPHDYTQRIEKKYLNKTFAVGTSNIAFDKSSLQQIALIYSQALVHIRNIYIDVVMKVNRAVDFELSIDETMTPTSPQAHFFVAAEMENSDVVASSVAPRFCGEFQKGIDYIGDIVQFEEEFAVHAAIADHFGYRLSIHSGSDKFKVFPIIGRYTRGRVHVKTAGTNWLEALKTISKVNPVLFRQIYSFSLEHFNEATKYYHVTTNLNRVPDIQMFADSELSSLLGQDDVRQMLHITYGLVLNAKDQDGKLSLREAIYTTLDNNEEDYWLSLQQHIGKHLQTLGAM